MRVRLKIPLKFLSRFSDAVIHVFSTALAAYSVPVKVCKFAWAVRNRS
jgi:hypothetical protein